MGSERCQLLVNQQQNGLVKGRGLLELGHKDAQDNKDAQDAGNSSFSLAIVGA
jgi:hypothetical protein